MSRTAKLEHDIPKNNMNMKMPSQGNCKNVFNDLIYFDHKDLLIELSKLCLKPVYIRKNYLFS